MCVGQCQASILQEIELFVMKRVSTHRRFTSRASDLETYNFSFVIQQPQATMDGRQTRSCSGARSIVREGVIAHPRAHGTNVQKCWLMFFTNKKCPRSECRYHIPLTFDHNLQEPADRVRSYLVSSLLALRHVFVQVG